MNTYLVYLLGQTDPIEVTGQVGLSGVDNIGFQGPDGQPVAIFSKASFSHMILKPE